MLASKVGGALGVPESVVRRVHQLAAAARARRGPEALVSSGRRRRARRGAERRSGRTRSTPSARRSAAGTPRGDAAGSAGSDLLASLLGGGTTGNDRLEARPATPESTARPPGPLLGLAGSMALGGLKKTADDQGLDAAGVLRLLHPRRATSPRRIPADFAAKLEGTDFLGADLLTAAAAGAAAAAGRARPLRRRRPARRRRAAAGSSAWSCWRCSPGCCRAASAGPTRRRRGGGAPPAAGKPPSRRRRPRPASSRPAAAEPAPR